MSESETLLVSIVINNHNYGAYLRAAIDSALAQTYAHVEVIVVDSGSTDNSREIIAQYGGRVRSVFKEAEGQPSTCNAGIANSRGDAIILLDSDDQLRPGVAARVAEALSADRDVAWVQYRLEVIDQDGRRTGAIKPADHLPRRQGDLRPYILAGPFDLTRMATSGNAFAAWALKQVVPIPTDGYSPSGVDWYLCPLIGLFGRVVFLDEVGGDYRLHGSNANWYERPAQTVDLRGLRRDLELMTVTAAHIRAFAERLELNPPREILSVAYVVNRMLSFRFDPATHPVPEDSRVGLIMLGVRASRRRFDISWLMRLMFMTWFVTVALAPGPLVHRLADLLLFPSRRRPLNPVLALLHLGTFNPPPQRARTAAR